MSNETRVYCFSQGGQTMASKLQLAHGSTSTCLQWLLELVGVQQTAYEISVSSCLQIYHILTIFKITSVIYIYNYLGLVAVV